MARPESATPGRERERESKAQWKHWDPWSNERNCCVACQASKDKHERNTWRTNKTLQLWGLLAHRLCYDRNNATPTGKWGRVKRIAYAMHLEIFDALRPFYFLQKWREKKKAWWSCTWQRLPVPFQEFLDSEHKGIREYFRHDYDIDTDAIYSSLRGDFFSTELLG